MSGLVPLIVVLGSTASGKSTLGIELAGQLNGEILVCDSTQIYKHFDIGTGKVPAPEQKGIAHHLVDLIEPEEIFTAGEYRRRAEGVLEALQAPGKMPVVTAGTGLYLRALLEGLADAPERSEEIRERLRSIVERRGPEHLHRILKRLDPETADRIGVPDTQKIIRAIEMRLLAGKTVGDIHRGGRAPLQGYRIFKIGLAPPREALYQHIHSRIDAMVRVGWIEEVEALIKSGIPADAKPFQFIGYSEWREFLKGKISKPDAIQKIRQATRRFAKRQLTWFRREPDVHWLSGFGDSNETFSATVAILKSQKTS